MPKKLIKDSDFNLWIGTSLAYEYYRRRHKKIPDELKEKRKKALKWVNNLSASQYQALIG